MSKASREEDSELKRTIQPLVLRSRRYPLNRDQAGAFGTKN
jgi:hypothetical protein